MAKRLKKPETASTARNISKLNISSIQYRDKVSVCSSYPQLEEYCSFPELFASHARIQKTKQAVRRRQIYQPSERAYFFPCLDLADAVTAIF